MKDVGPFRIPVTGKIEESYKGSEYYYYRLRTPTLSEYKNGHPLAIRSVDRIGEVGDIVEVNCELSGWSEHIRKKDGGSFTKAFNQLTVIPR